MLSFLPRRSSNSRTKVPNHTDSRAQLSNVRQSKEVSRDQGQENASDRPDFLCIGAQRAGTTWLYHQLKSHPDFWMPPVKELNYFSAMSRSRHPPPATWREVKPRDARDKFFVEAMENLCAQPLLDLAGYGRMFLPKEDLLSGDVTPVYGIVPDEMIAAITRHFPELRIIYLARDPVAQVWSALAMAVRSGGIARFDATDPAAVISLLYHPDILCRAFPSMSVARWRRHVPASQLQVFFFDDLQADPEGLRADIIRFLGGDPAKAQTPAEERINGSSEKEPMNARVTESLAQFFATELETCARELGGAAKQWPARYGR